MVFKFVNVIVLAPLSFRSECKEATPADVLSLVWSMVESIRQRDFQFVKFHCGPECPSKNCPGDSPKMSALSNGLLVSRRRHIFNILPACKDGSHRVNLYCLNRNFKSSLKNWIPNYSDP